MKLRPLQKSTTDENTENQRTDGALSQLIHLQHKFSTLVYRIFAKQGVERSKSQRGIGGLM